MIINELFFNEDLKEDNFNDLDESIQEVEP